MVIDSFSKTRTRVAGQGAGAFSRNDNKNCSTMDENPVVGTSLRHVRNFYRSTTKPEKLKSWTKDKTIQVPNVFLEIEVDRRPSYPPSFSSTLFDPFE